MGQRGDCHGGWDTHTHTPIHKGTHSVAQIPRAEPGEYEQADAFRSQPRIPTHSHTNPKNTLPHASTQTPLPRCVWLPHSLQGRPPSRAQAHTRAHTDLGEGCEWAPGPVRALPVLPGRLQRRLFIRLSAARGMPGASVPCCQGGGTEGGRAGERAGKGGGAGPERSPGGRPDRCPCRAPPGGCACRRMAPSQFFQRVFHSCITSTVPTSLQGAGTRDSGWGWGED